MIIHTIVELPPHLKRGFISKIDRKMVYPSACGNYTRLKASYAHFKYTYEANYYHQCNIFSRIIARSLHEGYLDVDFVVSDGFTRIHQRLIDGDYTAWNEMLYHAPKAANFKKLVSKCLTYIIGCDDYYKLLPLLKSYWTHVLKLPLPFLSAYHEGAKDWKDPSIFEVDRLLTTPTFQKLSEEQRNQWISHLRAYTQDIKLVEKLEAVKDYAQILIEDHGEQYNFLAQSCKELLL